MADQTVDPNSTANAVDPNSTAVNNLGIAQQTSLYSGFPSLSSAYNPLYGYTGANRYPDIMDSQSPLGNGDPEKLGKARESYNTTDVNNADKNRDNLFESQQKHDTWDIAKPVVLSALAGGFLLAITSAIAGAAMNPRYMSYKRGMWGLGPKIYHGKGINRKPVLKAKHTSRMANATKFGIFGLVGGALFGAGAGGLSSMQ